MANTTINKVVLGNEVLLDLTADTVTPATLMLGYTAHDASGALITGEVADGNYIGYGLTDGTLPLVGVGVVGSAVLTATSPQVGTAQAGFTEI